MGSHSQQPRGFPLTAAPRNPTSWDLTSLKLDSDHAGQDDGISAHADFMSGWSDEQLDTLMEECYWRAGPGPQNCGTIGQSTPYGEN